ncbi:hypothetical protein NliqN6_4283 [Naganishia liquefaciens]|uniref:Glucose receptor Git3-like N-terminal domain-containing protein n=1 Tax=Naganishia liquefaciens TaxID=104408 RepID=A0A8H3YHR8_9TREE|nr:hypothetical protein NliqN6_4283 [Naganishia liquefaciens]
MSLTYYGKTAMISSIGAIVIEVLTVVSALYLLRPLYRQGVSKLRTKYLIGMVASDAALGIVGLIPTAHYLAGKPLKDGSKSCSAVGFVLTAVLFTQHIWTLIIAVTTYALLKHPLSHFTRLLHTYWFVPPVAVWLIAIAHSVAWQVAWGFTPSAGGALCYYGPGGNSYDRDLIQFIPRALVFLVVIVLYSRLFQFLRRPDTISLSESGRNTSYVEHALAEDREKNQRGAQAIGFWRKMGQAVGFPRKESTMQPLGDNIPPWELLHLNNVGLDLEKITIPCTRPVEQEAGLAALIPVTWKVPVDDLSRSDRLPTTSTLVGSDRSRSLSAPDLKRHPLSAQPMREDIEAAIVVPTLGMASDSKRHHSYQSDEPPSPLQLDDEAKINSDSDGKYYDAQPQVSLHESVRSETGEFDENEHPRQDGTVERDLRDFFLANQADNQGGEPIHESDLRGDESAAAYFNRQASLLMLYFPLAYMFIFAFSLVRLLYNMITAKPNAGLTIASLWFVLSAGLVDALVYGVAEFVIGRRVRRNLPGRLSKDPSLVHNA